MRGAGYFAVILTLLWIPPPARAQSRLSTRPSPPPQGITGSRDNANPKGAGTARISGRVVDAETGAPLRRAVVYVSAEGLEERRAATTDDRGRYAFAELPAGRYRLDAGKAGFAGMSYGQKRPFQPGRPIELRDGEATPRIDFTLPRGGVIAGRITDEYGEPIAGISVRAMRQGFAGGRKQLVPVSTASTDDRGQYRIYGLAASDYYVSAQTSDQGFDFARFESRDGFAPTYYPGTPSAAEAQKIRVPAGGEQSSVGFALIPARVCLVSGTVITSSGTPATQGFLMVQSGSPDDMSYTVTGGGMLRSDGSFTLSNLAPGDYVLRIGVGTEDDRESGSLPITVGGRDLTGLTLATTKPSPVSGQVLFESTPPESLRPGEFQFWMHPVMPTAMAWGGQLVTRDDWTLQGRASDGPLYVDAGRFPSGWMIKTVLLNGVDITETGFETRSGAAVDGLQVVLTDRLTRITGDVLDDLGRPARDYVVVIFPEDPARWHRFSRRQRAESADQQGQFEVSRLPPGRYLAVALDYLEVGEQEDREFLESMRAWATPVELHEGEAKTLALKLVSRP